MDPCHNGCLKGSSSDPNSDLSSPAGSGLGVESGVSVRWGFRVVSARVVWFGRRPRVLEEVAREALPKHVLRRVHSPVLQDRVLAYDRRLRDGSTRNFTL